MRGFARGIGAASEKSKRQRGGSAPADEPLEVACADERNRKPGRHSSVNELRPARPK